MATEIGITERQVLEALKQILDPELGVNIVDLGLVYGVTITGGDVRVKMTLTTPGCPMHDSLVRGAERALGRVPGVASAAVELVWEPPWSPQRISPEGLAAMGGARGQPRGRPGLTILWPSPRRPRDEDDRAS
jgi:metal-sulfur cluster biosynthetic enzyme